MPTTPKGPDVNDLNPQLRDGLNGLIDAVKQAGGSPQITSGYRSNAEQTALYNSGNGGVPVAKPGQSLHEKGLAADVSGDPHTMALLHAMAPKYGLDFPFSNDPVHVQLAGQASPVDAKTGANVDAATTASETKPLDLVGRLKVVAGMLNPSGTTPLNAGEADTTAASQADVSGVGPANTATAGASQAATEGQPTGNAATTAPAQQSAGPGGDINSFMNSIAKQESGGDYNVTNKDSGAHGKYQIMPANWSSWAQEAGLSANAPQTPDNQEKVARAKMEQYYKQFGNWHDVAVAWYAGPGAVGKVGNASQGNYPTIDQYANNVAGAK